MQFCRPAACKFDTDVSEPLASISVYRHAMIFDYNRSPIKTGAGSAFFLHESAGTPTAGCVAVNGAALTRVMRWLRPGAAPVISIAVGSKAYEPISSTA
jgi:L,D-peptidoglycan transpeptidase YkuD (ErfK/YbiS/YcfS/YnhG family)